ncbi:hypothetical protein [Aeromicrobium sp. IC_218]|uniref:SCO7613 C-terminal domain-containing membrane protein n=1 Tax=Aeromicrobium sp. IC_218 TaxID=2545468 RepID=UPI0010408E2C|nr:hypothetical protein [Aeromicrobium sp. IC_218]TCJ00112.1 hypothetical protein E0W78_02605 [Aeromicrobium sp. IC_218]
MTFADASVCPDCRSTLGGAVRCPACGLDLTTRPARELWQTLRRADEQLAAARTASRPVAAAVPPQPQRAPAPAPAAVPAGPPHPAGPYPAYPSYRGDARPQPAGPGPLVGPRTPSPGASVGSILLALGALMLLVASIIFVSFAWAVVGVAGRVVIMLVLTALATALAVVLTWRRLRASAETAWVLVVGTVTIDWFAAYGLDLAGLRAAPVEAVVVVWSLVALALGLAAGRWSAGPLDGRLRAPGVLGAAATAVAALVLVVVLLAEHGWSVSWAVAVAALLPGLAAGAAHLSGDTWGRLVGLAGVGAGAFVFVLAALTELAADPSAVVSGLTGLPLLVVAAVLLGAAQAVPSRRAWFACAGALTLLVLVLVPLQDADPWRAPLLTASVLAVVLAAVPVSGGGWSRGLRAAAVPLAALLALALLSWWSEILAAPRLADGTGLGVVPAEDAGVGRVLDAYVVTPWWVVLPVGVALAATVLLARRSLPDLPAPLRTASDWLPFAAAVLVALTLGPAVQAAELPLALVAGVTVLGLALTTLFGRALPWPASVAAVAGSAVASLLVADALEASFLLACLVAVCLGVVALLDDRERVQAPATAIAALAAGAAVVVAVRLVSDEDRAWTLVAVLAGAVALGGALLASGLVRVAVQAAAVPLVVAGLAGAPTTGWSALLWCLLGVALVLVSWRVDHGRWWRLAGAVALGASYVLRLVASDVGVVEAYTAPFAAALLVAGVLAMRRRPALRSEAALSAGLALALLPTLPYVLADAASWRGLALGLVALAALVAGLVLHWRAPLVAGAAVLALVTLAGLGPYALVLPRWLLFGLVGTALLSAGIAWESAVRAGRAVAGRLAAMR